MANKTFSGAPFGVGTDRFDLNGIHPRRKLAGMVTQTASQDKLSMLTVEQKHGYRENITREPKHGCRQAKVPGIDWTRQLQTERIAAQPQLLYKQQWEQNQMLKTKLGPGSYEIKDFIQIAKEKPRSDRGLCGNLAPRFVKNPEASAPGPGTYRGSMLEEKITRSVRWPRSLFEQSCANRIATSGGSGLGPGTYSFKSGTDELLNKVTSLKGPYRLYSGDRNKPISEGHFAVPKPFHMGPGQYNFRSFVDDLHGSHRKYQGRFSKLAKNPEFDTDRISLYSKTQHPQMKDPLGPGAYNIQEVYKPTSANSPGFLSSSRRDDKMAHKFFTRNFNLVGPGRYDIQRFEEAQDVNGHSSVFKSNTGKLSLQASKVLHERIQGNSRKVENIFPFLHMAVTRPITVM